MDLRVRRTHKLLSEALLSLMAEKDFEAVRVGEICDRAMVHRTTFYKRYRDKYDLLQRGTRQMYDALLAEVDLPVEESARASAGDEPPPRYAALFSHVAAHERFYSLMLSREAGGQFASLLKTYLAERALSRIQDLTSNRKALAVPPELISWFDAGAILGVVSWWLENDMPHPPEEMARHLTYLIVRGNFAALGIEPSESASNTT